MFLDNNLAHIVVFQITADEVGAGGDQTIYFSFRGQGLDKKVPYHTTC